MTHDDRPSFSHPLSAENQTVPIAQAAVVPRPVFSSPETASAGTVEQPEHRPQSRHRASGARRSRQS